MTRPRTAGSWWKVVWRHRNAYLFIAPFYVLFLVFMVFPIGFSFWLSFQKWNGIISPTFVGLSNYTNLLRDSLFGRALSNTIVFTVLTVATSSAFAIVLAVFLNSVRVFRHFYRGVFFLPTIVSLVVISLIWKLILNSEVGLINEMIQRFGHFWASLTGTMPAWTQRTYHFLDNPSPWVPLLTLVFVNVWGVVGYNTVIYLAALQSIPLNLYEASRIDGATPIQRFFFVTLPLLRPAIYFVVLITSIDSLQVFVLPSLMTPNNQATISIVYYVFRNAFEFYRMGFASAAAYVLFALTAVLGLTIRFTLGRETRWVPEE
ncbi:MAG: sugar ABC transporter permease [Candidatus Sumerlaeaceae bacterium]|nr:sugar ABC transporter permease [Candidatus Sumerlaeaceae bacterium]